MGRPKKVISSTNPTIKVELVTVSDRLKSLLKLKMPGCFEREPSPAYADGNLNNLVAEINKLY